MKVWVGAVGVGAAFGAGTSLVNQVSSAYSPLGRPLAGSVWAAGAKVLSMLCDAGWSWAALAVVMGWLTGRWLRGALAGVPALSGATVAYYVTDHYVAGGPGVVGLLAALTVPLGAAAQMVLLPPQPTLTVTTTAVFAQAIVWVAAASGAAWALLRFRAEQRTAAG